MSPYPPPVCTSCGQHSSREQRVRCALCHGQVHSDCRDITGTCYDCRYEQARRNKLAEGMLTPVKAGRNPWKTNPPTTVVHSDPLPPLAEDGRPGACANALRIATHALWAGWHVGHWDVTDDINDVTMRKLGSGYMRLRIRPGSGRITSVTTSTGSLPCTTRTVMRYLETA